MISKKLFSFSKTKFGDLIVGLFFGKFSKLLPIKRIKETDKVIAYLTQSEEMSLSIL